MPYITGARKHAIDAHASPTTPGELNYKITKECLDFLGLSYGYTELNAIVGVLECAKAEFLRRVVATYEDKKIAENGDVYGKAMSASQFRNAEVPAERLIDREIFDAVIAQYKGMCHPYKSTGAGQCGVCGRQRGGIYHT